MYLCLSNMSVYQGSISPVELLCMVLLVVFVKLSPHLLVLLPICNMAPGCELMPLLNVLELINSLVVNWNSLSIFLPMVSYCHPTLQIDNCHDSYWGVDNSSILHQTSLAPVKDTTTWHEATPP